MLLSINETKIAELLKSSNRGYVVSTSQVPVAIENYRPIYTAVAGASGIVYAAPSSVTSEIRRHLITQRRRIEESGVPLKSTDVLATEIGEMRRRR